MLKNNMQSQKKWFQIGMRTKMITDTTYVRPLLEYNTVIWSPSLKCDVTAVEKVQRRFTKLLPGFRNLSYAERRSKLNLTTLELRRLHNDLVMCYKIMFNIIRLEFSNSSRSTHILLLVVIHINCIYVNHGHIDVRKHFFACVNVWNSLPLNSDDFVLFIVFVRL